MDRAVILLKRNLDSIVKQKFDDYEIIVSDDSEDDVLKKAIEKYPIKYFKNDGDKGMANNTNNAMDLAQGDLIKILYQDDYFYDETSLGKMVRAFSRKTTWVASGCVHTVDGKTLVNAHYPYYSHSENTIGSPSVTMFRRLIKERFDPQFSWVLDLDLYRRIFEKHRLPKLLNKVTVVIGLGSHQMTEIMSDDDKRKEFLLLDKKYDKG